MTLTGIEIYKYLPKTNCAECAIPTCLAFAMNVAAGKLALEKCPYLSKEIRVTLTDASAPPVRPVNFGTGDFLVKLGNDGVLYRHEKRFENPTALGLLLSSNDSPNQIDAQIESFKQNRYERMGSSLHADYFYVEDSEKTDPSAFVELAQKASLHGALMLCTSLPSTLEKALEKVAIHKPLIGSAGTENLDLFAALAIKYQLPLALIVTSTAQATLLSQKAQNLGVKDLVFSVGAASMREALHLCIEIRTKAIVDKNKFLGFPTILYPCAFTADLKEETLLATVLMAKYASGVVLSNFKAETLYPLLTARQNIYTDPQRPLTMPSGIYPIGNPTPDSPVILSCNFSLTYYIVSAEIGNSAVPAYFIIKDTEGLSVLTAWAAGKFSADSIAAFVKKSGISEKVNHRRLIVPGFISVESGALEEALGNWQVIVGPTNAADLPAFLK